MLFSKVKATPHKNSRGCLAAPRVTSEVPETHSFYLPHRFCAQDRRACHGPPITRGAPRKEESRDDLLPKPHTQPQPPLPPADAAGALPHSAQT